MRQAQHEKVCKQLQIKIFPFEITAALKELWF